MEKFSGSNKVLLDMGRRTCAHREDYDPVGYIYSLWCFRLVSNHWWKTFSLLIFTQYYLLSKDKCDIQNDHWFLICKYLMLYWCHWHCLNKSLINILPVSLMCFTRNGLHITFHISDLAFVVTVIVLRNPFLLNQYTMISMCDNVTL